eukprot:bmy_21502T0
MDPPLLCCSRDSPTTDSSALTHHPKAMPRADAPDIQNPDPAVYQLRSPKSSNTSVCLYTDFQSQANESQVTRPVVYSSDSTVLDMGAVGSKSNGVVAWGSSADLGCTDTFNQTFYSSLGISCDTKIVEKSFETGLQERESPVLPLPLFLVAPPLPLQAERCTLCPRGQEGSLHLSGPTGNTTNWILPDIRDQDAEELPSTAATPSVPSLLLVTAWHSQQRRRPLQPLLAVGKLPPRPAPPRDCL